MNKRLKYLLEKLEVAGLDKEERYELDKLLIGGNDVQSNN